MDGNLIGAPLFVPSENLAAMWVTFFVTALLPPAGWLYLSRCWKGGGTAVLAGALGFYLTQMLVRIPLLSAPAVGAYLNRLYGQSSAAYFLLMAFTAGLFETAGRLFVFRSLLHKRLSYRTGLAAGYGHGAVEAFLLIGLTYGANLYLSYSINGGAPLPGDPAVAAGMAQLAALPYGIFLVAGLERILTACFHIAVSLYLCFMVSEGKSGKGFLICLIAHAALDFIVPQIQARTGSYLLSESAMAVVAAVSVWLILGLRKKFALRDIPPDLAGEAAEEGY